jgi:predicted transcriptional regulator
MGIVNMVVDSPDLPQRYFKKTIRNDMDKVTLDAEMIRLLTAINENKNISQVAKAAEMNLSRVREILGKLLKMGLVVQVTKEIIFLDRAFIGFLLAKLSEAVGPMGEILIEDVMDKMGLQLDRIPLDAASDLVGNIAREIPQEENRTLFEKSVLSRIPRR